jgi:hypothetical protein
MDVRGTPSITLQFAKHVDLDVLEPNKLRHKGPIGSSDCPACTRDYVGKHRKDIVDCA